MPFLPKFFSNNNVGYIALQTQSFEFLQRFDQPILFGSIFYNGLRKTKQPTQTTFYSNNVKIKKIALKCLYQAPRGSFNFMLQKNGVDLPNTLCLVEMDNTQLLEINCNEKFSNTDLINFKISTVESLTGYGVSIYGYVLYESS